MSRRHRWIRGDWQLAGWLLPRVPGPGRRRLPNPLSALSQWKLFDNLRRSLVPPALTLAAAARMDRASACLAVDAGRASRSSLLPSACAVVLQCAAKPDEVLPEQHLAATASVARPQRGANGARRSPSSPTRRRVNLDAIARTCWRMLVTHRRLLEWNPSAMEDPDRRRGGTHASARACGVGRVDVDRPGHRRGRRRSCWRRSARSRWRPPRRSSCCGSSRRRIAWWVSRPLARREAQPRDRADRSSCASSRAGPGPSSRRSSARTTSGCRPTTTRSIRSPWSRIAPRRPTWDSRCSRISTAYDFGYIPAGQLLAAHGECARHDGGAGALRGPFLQLVRHADAASRCRRSMSRRWTAAISRATC